MANDVDSTACSLLALASFTFSDLAWAAAAAAADCVLPVATRRATALKMRTEYGFSKFVCCMPIWMSEEGGEIASLHVRGELSGQKDASVHDALLAWEYITMDWMNWSLLPAKKQQQQNTRQTLYYNNIHSIYLYLSVYFLRHKSMSVCVSERKSKKSWQKKR